MTSFERNRSTFVNKDALSESYQPHQIEERDEEIAVYMDALQPIVDGWEPNNIFLYGNTGVGKTAVTEYLLRMLEADVEAYDDVDLSVLTLNCNTLTSSYQVAIAMVNTLREPGDELSATGYPQRTVFTKLYSELEALGGTVLVVLDEIDSIGDRDELLYELPRARANGYLKQTSVGVIGISNDLQFRDQLDPRVKDTLCERELQFPPYEAPELANILASRAAVALNDGACDEGVLNLCAAIAARDSGSARQALDLLRLAGEAAESGEDEVIKESHVEDARQKLDAKRVEEGMRELTVHGKLVLLAIVSKTASRQIPCRGRDVYDEYRRLCAKAKTDPLVRRSVNNHLSDLRMFSIIDATENRSGSRGNYYSYELNVPFQSAVEAMGDALALGDELVRIRKRATQNKML